ncbi:MAG: hypothetical protein KatS3mg112_0351 [Thermogutta sp.]|nr:MAG: hypothetical protein KatS3mg112_0351 [Thermogutta sp.]
MSACRNGIGSTSVKTRKTFPFIILAAGAGPLANTQQHSPASFQAASSCGTQANRVFSSSLEDALGRQAPLANDFKAGRLRTDWPG